MHDAGGGAHTIYVLDSDNVTNVIIIHNALPPPTQRTSNHWRNFLHLQNCSRGANLSACVLHTAFCTMNFIFIKTTLWCGCETDGEDGWWNQTVSSDRLVSSSVLIRYRSSVKWLVSICRQTSWLPSTMHTWRRTEENKALTLFYSCWCDASGHAPGRNAAFLTSHTVTQTQPPRRRLGSRLRAQRRLEISSVSSLALRLGMPGRCVCLWEYADIERRLLTKS